MWIIAFDLISSVRACAGVCAGRCLEDGPVPPVLGHAGWILMLHESHEHIVLKMNVTQIGVLFDLFH